MSILSGASLANLWSTLLAFLIGLGGYQSGKNGERARSAEAEADARQKQQKAAADTRELTSDELAERMREDGF